MKLLRAEFENFRLLRDLEMEFSSDPNRNLTVIRAANESGENDTSACPAMGALRGRCTARQR